MLPRATSSRRCGGGNGHEEGFGRAPTRGGSLNQEPRLYRSCGEPAPGFSLMAGPTALICSPVNLFGLWVCAAHAFSVISFRDKNTIKDSYFRNPWSVEKSFDILRLI
jgi:hypothetical protein